METLLSSLSMEISDLLMPWLAVIISIVGTIWIKDFATNLAKGYMFYRNPAFMPGDSVYIDDKEARIISIGLRETIFETADSDNRVVWRYVPNHRIDYIKLEKIVE